MGWLWSSLSSLEELATNVVSSFTGRVSPFKRQLTTFRGTGPDHRQTARKIQDQRISSAKSVEILHGMSLGLCCQWLIRRQSLRQACTLGKDETQTLDKVGPLQVTRLFSSTCDNLLVPTLLNPAFLILAGLSISSALIHSISSDIGF